MAEEMSASTGNDPARFGGGDDCIRRSSRDPRFESSSSGVDDSAGGSPAAYTSDDFPMRVDLQRRGRARGPGETGAFNFQTWLGECKKRGYTVRLAWNRSHAIAEETR